MQNLLAARIWREPRSRARSSLLSSNLYANVIIDIQTTELKDKLFSYEIPEALQGEAFIGAHVLVPFGPKLVGGMIISLSETVSDKIKTIKQIAEIVEAEPLFDKEYVEFLYWVAEYYCAGVADVISAAIPSSFAPKFKKVVTLFDPRFR